MADTEKLIDSIVHGAGPVTPAAHPYVLSAKWLAGMAVYLALSLAIFGVRPDLSQSLHSFLFAAEIGLLAAIVISASLSAALLSFPDVHQKRLLAFTPVVMATFFVLVIFLAWHADTPASPPPIHSMQCTANISFLALLPAVWLLYLMRGFASTHPYLAGSIALVSAFSVGALSLRLSEPTDLIMHVIQWHYLPMVAVVILGLWLGKIFLKW